MLVHFEILISKVIVHTHTHTHTHKHALIVCSTCISEVVDVGVVAYAV